MSYAQYRVMICALVLLRLKFPFKMADNIYLQFLY